MSTEFNPGRPQGDGVVEQLGPQLAELERERHQLSEQTGKLLITIAVGSAIGALLLRLIVGSEWAGMAFLVPVVGVVAAVWLLLRRQNQWQRRVWDTAIPVICNSLGEISYEASASVQEFLPPFEKLGVVGSSNKRELQHHFRGRHRDIGFEFVDASLTRSSSGKNSSSTIVFQGLLFRIQLPFSVDQRVLVSPRVSISLLNKRGDMQEVKLDDPAFDEKFVVHHDLDKANGADLASQVLTPEFRSGLLELNQQEGQKAFDMAAFVIGVMYDSLYVAQSKFRKSGSIGKIQIESPAKFLDLRFFMLSDSRLEQRLAAMVHDIAIVYRIIDRLPLSR